MTDETTAPGADGELDLDTVRELVSSLLSERGSRAARRLASAPHDQHARTVLRTDVARIVRADRRLRPWHERIARAIDDGNPPLSDRRHGAVGGGIDDFNPPIGPGQPSRGAR